MSSFPDYTLLQNYQAKKQSSYDQKGANNDFIDLDPTKTVTIFSQSGPGIISHLWLTIGSGDPNALKDLVLRAYWDGNPRPSVEVPVGDFFGLNLNQYVNYQSAFLNCSPSMALNCYFSMPFRKTAVLTVEYEHQGPLWRPGITPNERVYVPSVRLYWNIDYRIVPSLPAECLYFHAQYRQQTPTPAVAAAPPNLTGAHNYVFVETRGSGHLMGITWGVQQIAPGWFGEGDDMTFIDDASTPAIYGTGTEDYINGAWDFGSAFANLYHGAALIENFQQSGALSLMYRWHADNPIVFREYLKHTIEHGTQNNRADNYYSVAYWYQTVPYTDFPALPPASARVPQPVHWRDTLKSPYEVAKLVR
jgi:Protein of unknown function (DUF2961)